MFCVSIAAEWDEKIVVGVIYHPILREHDVAVRGQGARLQRKTHPVSKTRKLNEALLTTGFTYQKQNFFIAKWARSNGSAGSPARSAARGARLSTGLHGAWSF